MSDGIHIIQGDARAIPLRDECVQCVVTSPPYWGLRKYAGEQDRVWGGSGCDHEWADETRIAATGGQTEKQTTNRGASGEGFTIESGTCHRCGAWRGGYGLEPKIEMYVAHTVEILREVRRVLCPDGVVFWNIGDSYANDGKWGGNSGGKHVSDLHGKPGGMGREKRDSGLKPKDLCLIPERVAIAAQADGWWVRSIIIWAKPNPMPESCTDRPTDAYEHIIMLTKSERYFWDADAVREPSVDPGRPNLDGGSAIQGSSHLSDNPRIPVEPRPANGNGRNLRNVWTFPTQPYKGAHFATFPEEIPRRCILAATSERGACAECGTPWARITESKFHGNWNPGPGSNGPLKVNQQTADRKGNAFAEDYEPPKTVGWEPTCKCLTGPSQPCLVLDPFGGSGTTARVAVELNRRAVSLDLAYHDHAEKRTRNVQRRLVG